MDTFLIAQNTKDIIFDTLSRPSLPTIKTRVVESTTSSSQISKSSSVSSQSITSSSSSISSASISNSSTISSVSSTTISSSKSSSLSNLPATSDNSFVLLPFFTFPLAIILLYYGFKTYKLAQKKSFEYSMTNGGL